ncbi:hypothetical protein ACFSVJ_19905 [Prauserella oleivorans]
MAEEKKEKREDEESEKSGLKPAQLIAAGWRRRPRRFCARSSASTGR